MRSLSNGLARAAVRFRPASFAGTFVALMMAAMIVSACGIMLETGTRADTPPARYARTPVVVSADQQAHLSTRHGGRGEDDPAQVPDRARLDAALLTTVARTAGVAEAVRDVTVPVRAGTPAPADGSAGAPAPAARTPLTAHGWGAAPFTGASLTSGSAPRPGEAVLDGAAARVIGAGVGDRIALTTGGGEHRIRISGIARTPSTGADGPQLWVTDAQASRMSGHPDAVDAILVRPTTGISPDRLADRLERALHAAAGDAGRAGGAGQARAAHGTTASGRIAASAATARVHTGDGRGGAEHPGLAGAREMLIALGGSFGGVATMTAVFTTAGTVALSVGQRRREFALLRAIGATPRQIRRSLATEALLIAPVAGAIGCLPGVALASWWFDQLKDRGAIPEPVTLSVSWIPLTSAIGAGLVTALLAGLVAAHRPARIKPGLALGEAAVERFRPGVIRTLLGLGALTGGIVLAAVAAKESGDDAATAALGVVMLFMLAVALLGPLLAPLCAWLLGLPLRVGPAAAHLASANARANSRRLASAITPIVLAMAFASTLVFLHTSEDHVATAERHAGITADRIVSAPDGLPAGTARRAAATPGVAHAVGVLRTGVLVPVRSGGTMLQTVSAQGVGATGDALATVQDLQVRAGRLAGLRPGTVALDSRLAEAAGVGIGERLELRLPDGTRHRTTVVALYGRGLGIAQVTLSRSVLVGHVTTPLDNDVLIRTERGADPAAVSARLAALGEVTDRAGYQTARDRDQELNAWANTTMAAVLGGFAAVAAANTLVMTVLDRRRELGTLRLIGTTQRQILRMVRWEALLVTAAGIGLGTAIALVTLDPLVRGLTGQGPYIPIPIYASFAGATLALGLAATALPARAALRGAVSGGGRG
ncbi:ABC transporter permease [Streptomyces albus subsp. albus]|nr:ABC transporter permease [Streptomyces albus subsp. albus]